MATEICRSYRNSGGECRWGEDCKFEHSLGDAIVPPPREAGECFLWRDSGSCKHGDNCRFQHGDDDARFTEGIKDMSQEICRNFNKSRCALGDQCPRKHEAGAGGADKPKGRRARKPVEDDSPVEDQVCRNYAKGRCRFGSECPRKHDGEVDQTPPEKLDEVCNNFKEGRCRFGDFCRRKHEE